MHAEYRIFVYMYTICPLSGAAPRSSYLVVNVALYRGRGSHRGVLRGAVGRAVPILESLLGSESLVPAVQGAANPPWWYMFVHRGY